MSNRLFFSLQQLLDSAGIMRKPDKHFGDYRSQTPLRNYTPRAPLAYLCAYPKLNPLQIKREKGSFLVVSKLKQPTFKTCTKSSEHRPGSLSRDSRALSNAVDFKKWICCRIPSVMAVQVISRVYTRGEHKMMVHCFPLFCVAKTIRNNVKLKKSVAPFERRI